MYRRLLISAVVAGVVLGSTGCRHKCCSSGLSRQPKPYLPPPPGGSFLGPPTSSGATIPPAGVPTTPPPPPPVIPPVGPGGSSAPPPPILEPPPGASSLPPAPPPSSGSNKPGPELLLPDPLPGGPSSRSLYPVPKAPTKGVLGPPQKPATAAPTLQPPVTAPAVPALTGLPGFTRIADGISTGRKPALDGFDSLKQTGYRTVVYLHPEGADLSAARDVAEKRGLTFVSIETTPETLPAAVTRVQEAVANQANRPVYVYDDDGLRTGAVWYLYLRTVDAQNSDVAKVRARGIGLTDQTDEGKAFWVAIHKYIATR